MQRRVLGFAVTLIAYAYVGYPLALAVLAWRPRPRPLAALSLPSVRIVVAAQNEAAHLPALLRSAAATAYLRGLLAVSVVLDGCTDGTAAVAETLRPLLVEAGVVLVLHEEPVQHGKGAALTRMVAASTEPVLVCTNANVVLDPAAVGTLVRRFDDPAVGAVACRRRPLPDPRPVPGYADQLYWRYEASVKGREALLASCAGADGALYAVRRACFVPPVGCADDLEISLGVVAAGFRLDYAPEALAQESSTPRLADEYRPRLRTQSCALTAFWRYRALLGSRRPLVAWILVSHKLVCYAVPYAAVAAAGALLWERRSRLLLVRAPLSAAGGGVIPGRPVSRWHRLRGGVLYGLLAQAAAALAPFTLLRRPRAVGRRTPR